MELTPEEIGRYQRHLGLPGFGVEAQLRLKQGAVLVIGAGGLGCPALLYLAAAGVGRIVIVDADCVDVSNLQRQVLFTSEDLGQPKAEAAARRLRALNPLICIEPRVERLNRANAVDLIASVDVVVDGSDNFDTRYLVNDACVLAKRPFVFAAIQGFEGQASVFNWRGGPTYRCLFPVQPPSGLAPNCAEAGVLGVLPGLLGTIQATEAIKLLTGVGEPLSGRLLLWDALTHGTRILTFQADSRAPAITDLAPEEAAAACAGSPDEIDAAALRDWLPHIQLLDVREAWERAQGAISPSLHVPLAGLGDVDFAAHGWLVNRPTVVFCASGLRSLRALTVLRRAHGFSQVASLRGGFGNWSKKHAIS